jgi:hypothetical protein
MRSRKSGQRWCERGAPFCSLLSGLRVGTWKIGICFGLNGAPPLHWFFLHLAHLHCRSSACALFSPASARSVTSIR